MLFRYKSVVDIRRDSGKAFGEMILIAQTDAEIAIAIAEARAYALCEQRENERESGAAPHPQSVAALIVLNENLRKEQLSRKRALEHLPDKMEFERQWQRHQERAAQSDLARVVGEWQL